MGVTFAVDIDGTIAGRNMLHFAQLCNCRLSLGIKSVQLVNVSYRAFMQLSEVLSYRQSVGDSRFLADIESIDDEIDHSPDGLLSLPVLPGAVDGVRLLSEIGAVSYYTVRPSVLQTQDATRAWLLNNGFPYPDAVVFCKSIASKLVGMYKLAQSGGHVFLIDDMWPKLLDAYNQLYAGQQHPRFTPTQCAVITESLQQLTLVAFGASLLPPDNGLHMAALRSWEYIDCLISLVRKEFPLLVSFSHLC